MSENKGESKNKVKEEKKYHYPPRIDKNEYDYNFIKKEIAKCIPSRGVYLLIFVYAIDVEKGTPMDRILWLEAEVERRCTLLREMKDANLRRDLYNQFKIKELWNVTPDGSDRGNARKVAIRLSRLYCIVFDRPMPLKTIKYKKKYERKVNDMNSWGGYSYETEEEDVEVTVWCMTKNFKILKRTDSSVMIGRAQTIFNLIIKAHCMIFR